MLLNKYLIFFSDDVLTRAFSNQVIVSSNSQVFMISVLITKTPLIFVIIYIYI